MRIMDVLHGQGEASCCTTTDGSGGGREGRVLRCCVRFLKRRACMTRRRRRGRKAEVGLPPFLEQVVGEAEKGVDGGSLPLEMDESTVDEDERFSAEESLEIDHSAGNGEGHSGIQDSRCSSGVFSERRTEEVCFNLAMGAGLFFLLAKGTSEFSKMMELRMEMEMMLKDIKHAMQNRDEVASHSVDSKNGFALTSSESCRRRSADEYQPMQTDPSSLQSSSKNCSSSLKMRQLEEELASEIEQLLNLERAESKENSGCEAKVPDYKSNALLIDAARYNELETNPIEKNYEDQRNCDEVSDPVGRNHEVEKADSSDEIHDEGTSQEKFAVESDYYVEDSYEYEIDPTDESYGEGTEPAEGIYEEESNLKVENMDNEHDDDDKLFCGVPPQELERKLHEVLQIRQQERIAELEFALQRARVKLHEKEEEIGWWRDTARIVLQHKEGVFFR